VSDGVVFLDAASYRLKELTSGRKVDWQLILHDFFVWNTLPNCISRKVLPLARPIVWAEYIRSIQWGNHAIYGATSGGVVHLDLAILRAVEGNCASSATLIYVVINFIQTEAKLKKQWLDNGVKSR
jgi:hypothetical protein